MQDSDNLHFSAEQFDYIEYMKTGISSGYILSCLAMIFFMQSGFIMVECGSIKKCHYSDVVVKNILDSVTGVLGFWLAGFGIAFGTSNKYGLFGIDGRYYCSKEFGTIQDENLWIKWLFQLAFCNTSSTVVSGLMTEKCRIEVYAVVSFFMSFFIYPVVAHWAWNENGWLAVRGYQDFAGSGVIHLLGGLVGLIGNIFSGSRIRKNPGKLQFPFLKGQFRLKKLQQFEENERKNVENLQEVLEIQQIAENNILDNDDIRNMQRVVLEDYDYPTFYPESYGSVLIVIGTYILFIGWLFFNAGSAYTLFPGKDEAPLGKIIVNTIISGCAASFVGCLLKNPIMSLGSTATLSQCFKIYQTYNLSGLANGLLAGLVAITASCNVVEPYFSLVIGLIGGLVYCFFLKLLNSWNIDDHIEASAVHFANGIWGLLACCIFDNKRGLFTSHEGKGSYVAIQCYAILSIFAWGTLCSLVFFGSFYCIGWYKYHPIIEQMGVGNFKMGEIGKRFKKKIIPEPIVDKTINVEGLFGDATFQLHNDLNILQQNQEDIQSLDQISSISSQSGKAEYGSRSCSRAPQVAFNKVAPSPPEEQSHKEECSYRSASLGLLNNLEQSCSRDEIDGEPSLRSQGISPSAEQQKLRSVQKKISQTEVFNEVWQFNMIQEEISQKDPLYFYEESKKEEQSVVNQFLFEEPELELQDIDEEEDICDISVEDN